MGKHIQEEDLKTINGKQLVGSGDIELDDVKVDDRTIEKNEAGKLRIKSSFDINTPLKWQSRGETKLIIDGNRILFGSESEQYFAGITKYKVATTNFKAENGRIELYKYDNIEQRSRVTVIENGTIGVIDSGGNLFGVSIPRGMHAQNNNMVISVNGKLADEEGNIDLQVGGITSDDIGTGLEFVDGKLSIGKVNGSFRSIDSNENEGLVIGSIDRLKEGKNATAYTMTDSTNAMIMQEVADITKGQTSTSITPYGLSYNISNLDSTKRSSLGISNDEIKFEVLRNGRTASLIMDRNGLRIFGSQYKGKEIRGTVATCEFVDEVLLRQLRYENFYRKLNNSRVIFEYTGIMYIRFNELLSESVIIELRNATTIKAIDPITNDVIMVISKIEFNNGNGAIPEELEGKSFIITNE